MSTFTHAVSTDNYGPAKFIVSANVYEGTHTTIAAALTSASSGDTIFIRPGTYTENLTLKAGVNLCAFDCDSTTPNVTISGKCTFTQAGTISISGIRLQTNSDFALAVTGSAASIVWLKNCFINALNNTAISFTTSNSSAFIHILQCVGDVGTTGIAIYSMSSTGVMVINNGSFTNSGASTTAASNSAGTVSVGFGGFASPFSTSSGGVCNFTYANINTSAQNAICFTTAGTGTCTIDYSDFISGSASALSVGTGTTVQILNSSTINSTNTNPITGAGSFRYGAVTFTNSGVGVNVTTQSPYPTYGGGWSKISTLTASASATLDFSTLPTYSIYAFVINGLTPATNASQLTLRFSNDNGSTFANSGYTSGVNYTSYNSATVTNVNATTSCLLTSNSSNAAGISGTIFVSTGNARYWGTTSYASTDSAVAAFGNSGGAGGIVANAFRFLMSAGNLTSGTVTIYGLIL